MARPQAAFPIPSGQISVGDSTKSGVGATRSVTALGSVSPETVPAYCHYYREGQRVVPFQPRVTLKDFADLHVRIISEQ